MSDNAQTKGRQAYKLIPEIWSKKWNKKLDVSGVGMLIVNNEYQGEISSKGDTVNIPGIPNVTVSDYDETKDITWQSPDADNTQLTITEQKTFGIKVSRITKKQAENKDFENKLMNSAKTQVEIVRDKYIMTTASAGVDSANVIGSVSAPVVLTPGNIYSLFARLAKVLKDNNAVETKKDKIYKPDAPADPLPYVVINPAIECILIQSKMFTPASQTTDVALREGSIGKVAGLDVLVSTNVETVDNKTTILAGINDALAYAGNLAEIEQTKAENSFHDKIKGLYLYGAKVVLPKALALAHVDVSSADNLNDAREAVIVQPAPAA